MPCSSTRCPGRPPYVLFPLTAGLPPMGSRSCCANSPSELNVEGLCRVETLSIILCVFFTTRDLQLHRHGPAVKAIQPPQGLHSFLLGHSVQTIQNKYQGESLQGAFSHSARTAPIIMLLIQGTPLKTTHLQRHG